jgi:hypothetical protein
MPNLCASCVHNDGPTCPAFPQGIPDDIRFWGGDHRSIWPGQEGTTVHVLKDGAESSFDDWLLTYALTPE